MSHLTKRHFKNRIDYLTLMIPEIAKKFGLKETEASIIMKSQWEFLRDQITSGEWNNIKIKRIGIFKVNPYKLAKAKANKIKRDQNRLDKLVIRDIKDGKQSGETGS